MKPIENLNPLDGRYQRHTRKLAEIFSEKGLIKNRIKVEVEYLIYLSQHSEIGTRNFNQNEIVEIQNLYNLTTENAEIAKAFETKGYNEIPATNHDVKAIEYYMKYKLKDTSLKDSLEWIHFALTSDDTNNISYGLMLADGLEQEILPTLQNLYTILNQFSITYANIPILGRTHGQPASPTTFGKEFRIFASRLKTQLNQLSTFKPKVKLNGATGNYNAHHVSYQDLDCIKFTENFIEKLNKNRRIKLEPNLITTQIEGHDTYAELFDNMKRINNILIDLSQDIWRYISDGWLKQKTIEGEVGSSTMPHKINPIDFEGGEGNFGIANALYTFFSSKLQISRLQRDLSDSTVERNFGSAFGYSLVGYKNIIKGLNKISVNEQKARDNLNSHPEIISEAIQTVLRREGENMPYEILKNLTRGRKTTMKDFKIFINELNISQTLKDELHQITPENYTGIAKLLAKNQ